MLQGLQRTTNVVDGWRPSSVRLCSPASFDLEPVKPD
jgi:hypothetical protein